MEVLPNPSGSELPVTRRRSNFGDFRNRLAPSPGSVLGKSGICQWFIHKTAACLLHGLRVLPNPCQVDARDDYEADKRDCLRDKDKKRAKTPSRTAWRRPGSGTTTRWAPAVAMQLRFAESFSAE